MPRSVKLSVTIITLNEETKIEGCLKSVLPVADEILVVDSGSTDRTKAICDQYPVRFLVHPFEGYVDQKNYAMQNAHFDHILSLDADERLSDELTTSILQVKDNWGDVDGYAMNRFNNYCGHWIRHCGWYPDHKIRLWDRRCARWEGTDPHDKVVMEKGKVTRLKGDLCTMHTCRWTSIYGRCKNSQRWRLEQSIRGE